MVSPQRVPVGEAYSLTHAQYVAMCTRIALDRQEVPTVRVQFRRRGEVFCGLVLEIAEMRDREWFACESAIDSRVWVQSSNVRLCSGDGLCTCEPAPAGEVGP